MPTIALDIHDLGLQAMAESGALGEPSPGYALLDRGDIVVGEAARAASRLKPRFVSDRHWDRMDMEGVGRPFPRALGHADLVYAHLARYWGELEAAIDLPLAQISVLLAVPGSYSLDQLSLLLGIARSCDMPITGLVDAAIAAVGDAEGEARTLHVDVRLHRAVLSLVERGARCRRTRVESVPGAGFLDVQRAWVRRIADGFVRATRFDPLHRGASEQALYNRLPELRHAIAAGGRGTLTLEARGEPLSIEITASELAEAAGTQIEAVATAAANVAADGELTVALSAQAAGLPGLATRLAAVAGSDPLLLPGGAATRGALRHRDRIEAPGHELPLVLDLPLRERHA